MNHNQSLLEENKRLRRLQIIVDLTQQYLAQIDSLKLLDVIIILQKLRNYSNFMFPDKEKVFNLIYKPKILRILKARDLVKFSRN
jgi:hypothetical protein